jgi:hypothetical protein
MLMVRLFFNATARSGIQRPAIGFPPARETVSSRLKTQRGLLANSWRDIARHLRIRGRSTNSKRPTQLLSQ